MSDITTNDPKSQAFPTGRHRTSSFFYSTVTDLAKLRGLSGSNPRKTAI